MPAKKNSSSSIETVHAAERKFKEALVQAKELKSQSRDAKRKLKQAKKAAKQASKAARVARKEAAKLRRQYEKTGKRAQTPKAAKSAKRAKSVVRRRKAENPAVMTAKRTRARRAPIPQRREPAPTLAPPAGDVDFDVAFSDADLETVGPN